MEQIGPPFGEGSMLTFQLRNQVQEINLLFQPVVCLCKVSFNRN